MLPLSAADVQVFDPSEVVNTWYTYTGNDDPVPTGNDDPVPTAKPDEIEGEDPEATMKRINTGVTSASIAVARHHKAYNVYCRMGGSSFLIAVAVALVVFLYTVIDGIGQPAIMTIAMMAQCQAQALNKMKLEAFFEGPMLLQKTIAVSTQLSGIVDVNSTAMGGASMSTAHILQEVISANRVAADIREYNPHAAYSISCTGDIHGAQLQDNRSILPMVYDAQSKTCWAWTNGSAASFGQTTSFLNSSCADLAASPPWWYQWGLDSVNSGSLAVTQRSGMLTTGEVGMVYAAFEEVATPNCTTVHMVEAEYEDVNRLITYSAGAKKTTVYAMSNDWKLVGSNQKSVAEGLIKSLVAADAAGGLTSSSAAKLKGDYATIAALSEAAKAGTIIEYAVGDRADRDAAELDTELGHKVGLGTFVGISEVRPCVQALCERWEPCVCHKPKNGTGRGT